MPDAASREEERKDQEEGLPPTPASAATATLTERDSTIQAVTTAAESRDAKALSAALARAEALEGLGPEDDTLILRARDVLERLQREAALVAELDAAIAARDRARLAAAIQRAEQEEGDSHGPRNASLSSALALQHRMALEDACAEKLRAATASRNKFALHEAIDQATAPELVGWQSEDLDEASQLLQSLEWEEEVLHELEEATSGEDSGALRAAIDRANERPDFHHATLDKAREVYKKLSFEARFLRGQSCLLVVSRLLVRSVMSCCELTCPTNVSWVPWS